MFILTLYEGNAKPRVFTFEPTTNSYTIGRDASCDKQILNKYVSRFHCQLSKATPEDWILFDGDPNSEGWLDKLAGISISSQGRKTIMMLPGLVATLISVTDYRVTLERERINLAEDPNRDTVDEQPITPTTMFSMLQDLVTSIKAEIVPLAANQRTIIERMDNADLKLETESTERKESDRTAKRDFESFKKPVMYAAGAVLFISMFNIFSGDKEIMGKILDITIALISAFVAVKAGTAIKK